MKLKKLSSWFQLLSNILYELCRWSYTDTYVSLWSESPSKILLYVAYSKTVSFQELENRL